MKFINFYLYIFLIMYLDKKSYDYDNIIGVLNTANL